VGDSDGSPVSQKSKGKKMTLKERTDAHRCLKCEEDEKWPKEGPKETIQSFHTRERRGGFYQEGKGEDKRNESDL